MSPGPAEEPEPLTPGARAWHAEGEPETTLGYTIHVRRRVGGAPMLLLLHGFPSSSYEWRFVLAQEREHAALAFDFLGFGCSDKPPDHAYSLLWQADLAEELVRVHSQGRSMLIVAHDMGASVATELIARDLEGKLEMETVGAVLLNANIVKERAGLGFARKVVRSRLGPLGRERHFRHELARLFSPDHPLGKEEAHDEWSLFDYHDGHRVADKLLGLLEEQTHAERWRRAFRDWPKPVRLVWGMRDPVATPEVLEGLRELRPGVEVTELEDVGHYPQLEAPERVVAALREALGVPH